MKLTRPCDRCGGTRFVVLKPIEGITVYTPPRNEFQGVAEVAIELACCLTCRATLTFATEPLEKLARWGDVVEVPGDERGPYR
jgi:hypothetical protein